MGTFIDYIPEGEPLNAQGNGFVDFVPEPKPVKHDEVKPEPVVEAKEEKPVETYKPIKKKGK